MTKSFLLSVGECRASQNHLFSHRRKKGEREREKREKERERREREIGRERKRGGREREAGKEV